MKVEDLAAQLPEDLVIVRRDALRRLARFALSLETMSSQCHLMAFGDPEGVDHEPDISDRRIDDLMETLVVTL